MFVASVGSFTHAKWFQVYGSIVGPLVAGLGLAPIPIPEASKVPVAYVVILPAVMPKAMPWLASFQALGSKMYCLPVDVVEMMASTVQPLFEVAWFMAA